MAFKNISVSDMGSDPFLTLNKKWMLITAGDRDKFNTMTAGWGGVGVVWDKNVAAIYIRPQRYTYEIIEKSDKVTLTFFPEEYRKCLTLCGTKSGRDIDKVKECGFTPREAANGGIYFEEAELVISGRKIYYDDLKPENFLSGDIAKWYEGDYHRVYLVEIEEVLVKQL